MPPTASETAVASDLSVEVVEILATLMADRSEPRRMVKEVSTKAVYSFSCLSTEKLVIWGMTTMKDPTKAL